ncbi:MAG: GNAT family N-acetyltransferase [Xanthobacteraceae bacterium]
MQTFLTIRTFLPADAEALMALVRELQAHEGQFYDRMKQPAEIHAWYVDALLKQCADEAGEILIGEMEGTVIAYATIFTRAVCDEIDEIPFTFARVGDLAVTSVRRGQGIGKAMLAECERRARAAGARWLRIASLAGNAQARSTYRSFGFEEQFVSSEKRLD